MVEGRVLRKKVWEKKGRKNDPGKECLRDQSNEGLGSGEGPGINPKKLPDSRKMCLLDQQFIGSRACASAGCLEKVLHIVG